MVLFSLITINAFRLRTDRPKEDVTPTSVDLQSVKLQHA